MDTPKNWSAEAFSMLYSDLSHRVESLESRLEEAEATIEELRYAGPQHTSSLTREMWESEDLMNQAFMDGEWDAL